MAVPSTVANMIFYLNLNNLSVFKESEIPFSVRSQTYTQFQCPGVTPLVFSLVTYLPGLILALSFHWFFCF